MSLMPWNRTVRHQALGGFVSVVASEMNRIRIKLTHIRVKLNRYEREDRDGLGCSATDLLLRAKKCVAR